MADPVPPSVDPVPGSDTKASGPNLGEIVAVNDTQEGPDGGHGCALLEDEKKSGVGAGAGVGGGPRGGRMPGRVNWSYRETVVLLDAKKSEEGAGAGAGAGQHQGAGGQQTGPKVPSLQTRWEAIAAACHARGVRKSGTQCCNRWDKLWPRFKRVFDYENDGRNGESYWRLLSSEKSRRGLPESFNRDIFGAMVERFGAERIASMAAGGGGQRSRPPPAAATTTPTPSPTPLLLTDHKHAGQELVDKISSTGLQKGQIDHCRSTGEEINNGVANHTPKKRKQESPKDEDEDEDEDEDSMHFQTIFQELESRSNQYYDQFVEPVISLVKDKLTSEDRGTAIICSSLNRIADALNNVAASVGSR